MRFVSIFFFILSQFLSTNVMSFRGKLNSYLFQGLLKFHDEVSGVEFNHYFASYVKVFSAIVTAVSWNKKFDLMTEQALKQLAKYNKLFRAFAQTAAAQVVLLLRLQVCSMLLYSKPSGLNDWTALIWWSLWSHDAERLTVLFNFSLLVTFIFMSSNLTSYISDFQSYCVDQNMPLMKIFAKMVLLLYKSMF